ncbi:hypothetical protein B1R94_14295 [Mycolicibacterium litorale]|nr:hypothetical protein B1R94_14295 [Mycolicibacterium litorale]
MKSERVRRQIVLLTAAVVIGGAGALTACGHEDKESPSTSTPAPSSSTPVTTSASVPAPAPTEKSGSDGGSNSFSPTVKAPPAPTAIPGNN